MSDQTNATLSARLLEGQPELREEAAESSLLDLLKSKSKTVTVGNLAVMCGTHSGT
jgi:hypothetical protein